MRGYVNGIRWVPVAGFTLRIQHGVQCVWASKATLCLVVTTTATIITNLCVACEMRGCSHTHTPHRCGA